MGEGGGWRMIEAHENIDLVTIRRQGDLETSRETAAEAVRVRAAATPEATAETGETGARLVEPRTDVPSEAAVSGRIDFETLVSVALAAVLALAAVGVWWRGCRRKR